MFRKKKRPQEKILILGLGGIGFYLAKRLLHEGYFITAIEPNPTLVSYADENLDARIINGNALSIDNWKEADPQGMDYLIAVTDNDAVNMLSAMIGDRFGIERKIARVRSSDFGQETSILTGDDLKIDLFIHPEELAAQEIARLIKQRSGNEIIDVALGHMQVLATKITPDSPFANKNLIEISKRYNAFPFRVVAVARGITTIIPGGNEVIYPQDHILIMANSDDLPELLDLVGVEQQRRQRVMLLGGGLLGSRIAELLGKSVRVKLVEQDTGRAEELSARLLDTEVLHGDGSDKDILTAAGLHDIDTFIAATGDNETNIMSSLLAKHLHSTKKGKNGESPLKTICLVNNEDYLVLASTSGLDIALNKKIMASNEILTYIRRSELLAVSHIHGFDVEVVDILAAPGSAITKKPLSNLYDILAGKVIIGSVFRDGKWETAVGSTHIAEGDRAIVICNSQYLKDVQTLFS